MRNSLLAAAAALILLPASAQADVFTIGSDLTATPTADMTEAHQADVLYFNTSKGPNGHVAPVAGQILSVKVKGTVVAAKDKAPNTLFHTQVLHDNRNGTYTVKSSSQGFHFPYDVPADTVTEFVPSVQCIEAGQIIDFNNVGGWDYDANHPGATRYQNGTPYQIFARKPGSQVFWYERDNGTNIGETFAPNKRVFNDPSGKPLREEVEGPREDKELMMQVVIGTGFDASNLCQGGLKGNEYRGLSIKQPWTAKVYDDGVVRVRATCPSNTHSYCEGQVSLVSGETEIGSSGKVRLKPNDTSNVTIPLANQGARIVVMRGQLEAVINADTYDGLGIAVPTQGTATLTAARPVPDGFAGLIVKAQVLRARGRTPQLKVTCPAGTAGSCAGTIRLQTAKRVRGKLIRVGTAKFSVQPGQTTNVGIKLTSAGKGLLRTTNKAATIAEIKARDEVGTAKTTRAKVTLSRR
jgi:hypothetical protein